MLFVKTLLYWRLHQYNKEKMKILLNKGHEWAMPKQRR